ncbi:MAG: CHRD domain-containing protein [Thermoproteota archaeon]|nr:CHRD domain-containing protein [Thermoproteota archaeon]
MKIKSTVTVTIFVIVIVALATITVGATIDFPTSAFAGEQQEEERFITELTGFEEVPPVNNTSAIGVAEFKLGQDNIMYIVNVTDIENVTAAHIHSGQVGENGPIVITLFEEDTPTTTMTTGVLSEGNITATNLEGPMAGKLLSNLTSAMSNDQTYVNVHTQQNPNGEIRGQILNETSAMAITK